MQENKQKGEMQKDLKIMKRQLEDMINDQKVQIQHLDTQNNYFKKLADVSKTLDDIMELSEEKTIFA